MIASDLIKFTAKLIPTLLIIFANFGNSAIADEQKLAPKCNEIKCLPPNCRCSSTLTPGGLSANNTPQFVLLTFDDAITVGNIDYYRSALTNRNNSDGCPISATFFVSHEYTDYSLVNQLYNDGHEIALHSISHSTSTTYWKNIDLKNLTDEFADERKLLSHFANIPIEELKGIRLPFLQMNGDASFEMLNKEGFLYDCSWPSRRYTNPGMWPYTLDAESTQDCVIGPCPQRAWNGTWVVPMLTWQDKRDFPCAMVDTCGDMPETVNELVEFMIGNFNRSYHTNKAPFGFYVHAAWFNVDGIYFSAYLKFIDYLMQLEDVFLVGVADLLKWVQNPIPVQTMKQNDWSKCHSKKRTTCARELTCALNLGKETRYMRQCSNCPYTYPWLGNPLGEKV